MITKIVIPAAGIGSRLLPVTKEIPKEMLPIFLRKKNEVIIKPLIHVLFERFYQLGIKEYCIVVGKQKRAIEDHFTPDYTFLRNLDRQFKKDLERFYKKIASTKIFWINQLKPNGFGDAVMHAESFVGKDDFLVSAGDTLILNDNEAMLKLIKTKLEGKNDALVILQEVSNPQRFGVATIRRKKLETVVTNVEEKPKKPKSNLAIVAIYRFRPSIFDALDEIKTKGKELQLTDGIQRLIERGGVVKAILINKKSKVIDIGTPSSYLDHLLEINRSERFLNKYTEFGY
jgi:UTP--glucose-1-phosphate uridylyltransferase